jgi:PTH1 family peptidyl-tRNA hydrolase
LLDTVTWKAVVGLGNPGREYERTRHNLGFEVVDELARRWRVRLKKWKGVAELALVHDRAVVVAKPTTYMNLSGIAVEKIASFYKIAPQSIFVVVDDIDLPLARLRARRAGSPGTHNGLRSVVQHIGTEFPRLRIGLGRGDPQWALADHVTSEFGPDERAAVEQAISRAADAVELFLTDGIEQTMNRFNAKGDQTTTEG